MALSHEEKYKRLNVEMILTIPKSKEILIILWYESKTEWKFKKETCPKSMYQSFKPSMVINETEEIQSERQA